MRRLILLLPLCGCSATDLTLSPPEVAMAEALVVETRDRDGTRYEAYDLAVASGVVLSTSSDDDTTFVAHYFDESLVSLGIAAGPLVVASREDPEALELFPLESHRATVVSGEVEDFAPLDPTAPIYVGKDLGSTSLTISLRAWGDVEKLSGVEVCSVTNPDLSCVTSDGDGAAVLVGLQNTEHVLSLTRGDLVRTLLMVAPTQQHLTLPGAVFMFRTDFQGTPFMPADFDTTGLVDVIAFTGLAEPTGVEVTLSPASGNATEHSGGGFVAQVEPGTYEATLTSSRFPYCGPTGLSDNWETARGTLRLVVEPGAVTHLHNINCL